MSSYTEFNKDMFLCNSFDNTSGVYYSKNSNSVLSTPSSLSEATFYNYTEILNLPVRTTEQNEEMELPPDNLGQHHKDSLTNIINPSNPRIPYDISLSLYTYLKTHAKTYADFQNSNPNDEWIYTFGQLVDSRIYTDRVPTTSEYNENNKNINVTYKPTY